MFTNICEYQSQLLKDWYRNFITIIVVTFLKLVLFRAQKAWEDNNAASPWKSFLFVLETLKLDSN